MNRQNREGERWRTEEERGREGGIKREKNRER